MKDEIYPSFAHAERDFENARERAHTGFTSECEHEPNTGKVGVSWCKHCEVPIVKDNDSWRLLSKDDPCPKCKQLTLTVSCFELWCDNDDCEWGR